MAFKTHRHKLNTIISDNKIVFPMAITNNLCIDSARGLVEGRELIHKFGASSVVSTGSFNDVWSDNSVYPWPTAAETIRIKAGGSADDDSGGSGARSIIIEGLDATFMPISETIVTAGASASAPTSQSFVRIHRAYVNTVGTYTGNNAGAIEIENTTSGNVIARIEASIGQTQMSHYTIPANTNGYLVDIYTQVATSKSIDFMFFQRQNADVISAPYQGKRLIQQFQQIEFPVQIMYNTPIILPPKTDIWAEAKSNAMSASACSVNYHLVQQTDPT